MSGRTVIKGSTNVSTVIRIVDSTDGTPETGVTSATAGLALIYRREGAATSALTESDLSLLTDAHSDGGMLHIDNGYYRVDIPDAAFATGADGVLISGTATGMVVIGTYHELVDHNGVWWVDDANGADTNDGFTEDSAKLTIGAAITAAAAGDTIKVLAGNYSEGLVISKALTIEGVGTGAVIQPAADTVALDITSDSVTLRNLTAIASGTASTGMGLRMNASQQFLIVENCDITGVIDGVFLTSPENFRFTNCRIKGSFDGFNASQGRGIIEGCMIENDCTDDTLGSPYNGLLNTSVATDGVVVVRDTTITVVEAADSDAALRGISGGEHFVLENVRIVVDQQHATNAGNCAGIFIQGSFDGCQHATNCRIEVKTAGTGTATGVDAATTETGQFLLTQCAISATISLGSSTAACIGVDADLVVMIGGHIETSNSGSGSVFDYEGTNGVAMGTLLDATKINGTLDYGTLKPSVIGRTLAVATGGHAGLDYDTTTGTVNNDDWGAGVLGAAQIASDAITAVKIGADAITAAKIASDAIGSAQLAASAAQEIADNVWDEAQADHVAAGSFGLIATEIASIETDTNELQVDWTDGGRLDLLLDRLITEMDTATGEPGLGAPGVSEKRGAKIDYLYKAWRNRSNQTATTWQLFADDATTVDQQATVSDDATTAEKGEIASG